MRRGECTPRLTVSRPDQVCGAEDLGEAGGVLAVHPGSTLVEVDPDALVERDVALDTARDLADDGVNTATGVLELEVLDTVGVEVVEQCLSFALVHEILLSVSGCW